MVNQMKKNIAIFASGTGSNFQAVAKACQEGIINAWVSLLVCDQPEALVISKAKKLKIEPFVFTVKDYQNKEAYEEAILAQLKGNHVDFVVLAGYMRLVGSTLLEAYPNKIVNIHPSLLPEFPGMNSIKRAFESGVGETGITVHYVDSGIDTGPIIAQRAVRIDENDTLESLEEKMHQVEHELYVEVLKGLCEDKEDEC